MSTSSIQLKKLWWVGPLYFLSLVSCRILPPSLHQCLAQRRPYAITLMIMHVVAGFITVYMLIKLTAAKSK